MPHQKYKLSEEWHETNAPLLKEARDKLNELALHASAARKDKHQRGAYDSLLKAANALDKARHHLEEMMLCDWPDSKIAYFGWRASARVPYDPDLH